AVTLSRKKVELPQLDDDIPTMADVLAELSKEPVSPASLELHREAAHAHAPIETQSEVNDPKIETREPQTPAEANDLPRPPIAAQLPAQKPPGKKQAKRAEPQPSDLEEITARPTRIRVPIERPRRERRPAFARAAFSHSPTDVMLFPTMLAWSRSTQESDDAEAGGMMSAFYTDAAASRFAQYRPYAAGGAVIAVMAIVLWAFSSTQDASNEVANETTPVPNSVIQQSQPSEVLAPQTTAVKTSVVKNA